MSRPPKFGKRAAPQEPKQDGELRWLGGWHSVQETLESKPDIARELWVEHQLNSPEIKEIIALARRREVKVQFMSRGEIDRATRGGKNQGVALKVFQKHGAAFNDWVRALTDEDKAGMVLVALDEIQDPHNLGAIARSAVNLGAKGLILPERRQAPVSAVAVASSAGAIQKIPVYKVVNLRQALERAREAGFWVYGADGAGKPVWDVALAAPCVLVIGSEGFGMREHTRDLCHELLAIPQAPGGVESLNASCAASVLLYELARQLRPAKA